METQSILIVEGSEAFRGALEEALLSIFQVYSCADGRLALELLQSLQPDVVVLDLMVPGLDGISLLETAVDRGLRAQVLATTRYLSDYVAESLEKLGVGYLMVKPCDVAATVERVKDLARNPLRQVPPASSRQVSVGAILFSLGIPTKLRGHACLREAILSMARKPGQSITKELYPEVARICNGTATQVERSIRSAIAAAWKNRDEALWRRYFMSDRAGKVGKPTNADFITRLADVLSVPEKEN